MFYSKLQLRVIHAYVIPVGLGVLVLQELFKKRIQPEAQNWIRLVALMAMMGSTGYYALAIVVVDCANGAATEVAPRLFTRLALLVEFVMLAHRRVMLVGQQFRPRHDTRIARHQQQGKHARQRRERPGAAGQTFGAPVHGGYPRDRSLAGAGEEVPAHWKHFRSGVMTDRTSARGDKRWQA